MASEVINILTTSVTSFLQGIGAGIVDLFEALFLTSENQLSALAIWVIVLFAVAIALGAVAWVSTLIRGNQR